MPNEPNLFIILNIQNIVCERGQDSVNTYNNSAKTNLNRNKFDVAKDVKKRKIRFENGPDQAKGQRENKTLKNFQSATQWEKQSSSSFRMLTHLAFCESLPPLTWTCDQ